MSKKSSPEKLPRIPREFKGIQVNCCKNTACENFGLTPELAQKTEKYQKSNEKTKERQVREKDPFYTLVSAQNKIATIKCKACVEVNLTSELPSQAFYILKSNKAVYEEFRRISKYLDSPLEVCANMECPSHDDPNLVNIKKRGFTSAKVQRYHCMTCGKSFTGKDINRAHNRTEIDKIFFKLLISQVSFKRTEFILDLDSKGLYRRINFIHRQCMAFVAERERNLSKLKKDRLYLCTDRQVQISNWTNRKEKQNCEFYGIGTADLYSGYVLAFNFNYDPSMNPQETEALAQSAGDMDKAKHHRDYARVWLQSDFNESKRASSKRPKALGGSITASIEQKSFIGAEFDIDRSSEYFDGNKRAPVKGMEVHNEYTMAAHFYLIKKLTKGVEKTRFFLDQDVGMKTWYIAAFKEDIKLGNSDGFHVTMLKDQTVDNKKQLSREDKEAISEFAGRSYSGMSKDERNHYIRQMIIANLENPFYTKKTNEAWVRNPKPSMAEPQRMVHAFTQISRYDIEHQANLISKGSLHAIDRFFMQIRRKVRIFERPIKSGTNQYRIWNGYSPYNPENYQKLADIFRVFYNYCQPIKKSGETPAMKLGLAKGVVSLEKIIYFDKYR